MLYICLDKNICCPFLVEQNRSRLESVWKLTSPVPLLPGVLGSFWSSRKSHLTDGSDVPLPCLWNVVICLRLINSHRSPRWLTKDAARTDIPACFRSSTHAQSQGFPLSRGGKGLQYHLLWSEGGARLEGLFQTLPDLGLDGKSGRACWSPRAGSPSGSGRSPRPRILDGSCFQYEALLPKHFILCPHECVFATENAQTVALKGWSLVELFASVEENNEDDSFGLKTRPQWLPIKKNKRGIKSQDHLATQAGKDWNKGVLCAASLMVFA